MSVWIELRCEESCEDHAEELVIDRSPKGIGSRNTSRCWSHDNNGCGLMSGSSNQADVLSTYKEVAQSALRCGWEKINGNWVCPHCVKYRGRKDLEFVGCRSY